MRKSRMYALSKKSARACAWAGCRACELGGVSGRGQQLLAAVDELLALGTDADHGDGQVETPLDELDESLRGSGQLLVGAAAGDVLVPAVELHVDGGSGHGSGQLLQLRAGPVAHAHLDGAQAGHDVQLRHGEVGRAVELHVVAQADQVEPGAVTGAARGRAELVARGLHVPPGVQVVLGLDVLGLHRLLALRGEAGGHDVVAHARQVGLEDRPHVTEVLGADAGAGEDRADGRDGGGAVLTVALLEAEAGALTTFGDDVPAGGELLAQPVGAVDQQRAEEGAEAAEASDHFVHLADLGPLAAIELGELVAHAGPDLLDLGAEHLVVEDVVHPDARAPAGLGGSRGADTALGGADLLLAASELARVVERDVEVGDHGGLGVEPEPAGRVQALVGELTHLLLEDVRVHQHTAGDQVVHAGASDAAGHEVERDLDGPAADLEDDGVPAVVGALEAHDGLGVFGLVVDEARLGFVTELSSEDHADASAGRGGGTGTGERSRHGFLHMSGEMQCHYWRHDGTYTTARAG